MKKNIFLFIVFVLLMSSCGEDTDNNGNILSTIDNIMNTDNMSVYISKELLPPRTEIHSFTETIISPDYESKFVFIDEHPFANWGHPCKYLFINPVTGEYTLLDKNSPPDIRDQMEVVKEMKFEEGGELLDFSKIETTRATANRDNLWAVIISGGGSANSNYIRYWNDCAAIYNILIKKYGYRKDQIYVIMADGTNPGIDRRLLNGGYDSSPLDLDNDGLADIQYAATRPNIQNTFNSLAGRLTDNDELFIFTTDHGDRSGNNSKLILWNNQIMYDDEFGALVNTINAKSINILMEQCYSGGFISHLSGNNKVIATACKADELSYARPDGLYNEFVYHWMSAAYGKKIDGNTIVSGDTNNDGFVTAQECFTYAKANDTRPETPQYSSVVENLGNKLPLNGVGDVVDCRIWIDDYVTYSYVALILNFRSEHAIETTIPVVINVRGEAMWRWGRWDIGEYADMDFETKENVSNLSIGRDNWRIPIRLIKRDDEDKLINGQLAWFDGILFANWICSFTSFRDNQYYYYYHIGNWYNGDLSGIKSFTRWWE